MPDPTSASKPGLIRRIWSGLARPSVKWSVLSLLVVGLVVGAGGVIATQVMVHETGTNEFCGGSCHSMQWVFKEYKQSVHFANRSGVQATCADCHIPHSYPAVLFYKAQAGIRDVIQESRGVISTEEKFNKERLRLAENVWKEFKANNSANCRTCHHPAAMSADKQSARAQKQHLKMADGKTTCVDCHKGIAHTEPEEAEEPAKEGEAKGAAAK